jgi:NAD(P)-dependent dehydrogenase (short-subunit alcohol dehydrogenase family)
MSSTVSTTGAVVLISGAGAGIGRACALRFATDGWRVLVLDRDERRAARVVEEIQAQGGDAAAVHGDVSQAAVSQSAVQTALTRWGHIDAVVANAGIQTAGRLLDTSDEDWRQVLAVNLDGVAHLCRAALPSLIAQHRGAIVIISSVNALQAVAGMAAYDTSKAAVIGLGRQLAVEHGRDGVRVNVICPGNTITDYHIDRLAAKGIGVEKIRELTRGYGLLGRAAEPHEIAAAVRFLAGDEASFITGQVLAVDGGFTASAAARH